MLIDMYMFVITLTLFRFSPLSRQIGAEQMNGSPGFRSKDLSHTKHANLCRWPANELVRIYTFA